MPAAGVRELITATISIVVSMAMAAGARATGGIGENGTSITVCAYNIFVGAREPGRRDALSRWLRRNVFAEVREGVAALTECNGWDQAFVEEFARASGARHGVLMPCQTGAMVILLTAV